MHIVLALTSIHDRFVNSKWESTYTELRHWSEGASLLNKRLSEPWPPEDRDALWTAAALLGAISFSNVEASTPEEAWPLRRADPADLQWLRMSDGKQIIWELANPLRPESAFHEMATQLMNDSMYSDKFVFDVDDVPPAFASLCNLNSSSTGENNPYYEAIRSLSVLLQLDCNHASISKYLSFVSHTGKEYKRLLIEKEPRALLLLSYWFAKVCHGIWWVAGRALIEGRAVCIYLERYYSHETAIMDLLSFPKKELGLIELGERALKEKPVFPSFRGGYAVLA